MTEPSIPTPIVFPKFLNNCEDADATPSSLNGTAFCTVNEKTGMLSPRPIPMILRNKTIR